MAIYTVHVPPESGDPVADAERAVFIADRFSWGAMIWGPLWFLRHRAWSGLLLWGVFAAALGLAFETLHPSRTTEFAMAALMAVFFGLEGRQLVRARWERRGYRLADVVWGRRLPDAEHAFFVRWLNSDEVSPAGRATPVRPRPAADEVIGLFPQAGGVA